ncbi:MAG: hypothetical protein ACI9Y7_001673 [Dokdonia sp.]|jgi:hypothetical protein
MKTLLFIMCLLSLSQLPPQKAFEGELIYHHTMKLNAGDYSESRNYFDTLKIVFKNKKFIKTTNKADYQKEIYVIYRNRLSKSKNLSMNEDNLNFGKLYNKENTHFGPIISSVTSDTIFHLQNKGYSLKKLLVKRKYGNETYVYSESDSLKLSDNRNILRYMGDQIHPTEIADIINNSLLYYYKLSATLVGIIEYR